MQAPELPGFGRMTLLLATVLTVALLATLGFASTDLEPAVRANLLSDAPRDRNGKIDPVPYGFPDMGQLVGRVKRNLYFQSRDLALVLMREGRHREALDVYVRALTAERNARFETPSDEVFDFLIARGAVRCLLHMSYPREAAEWADVYLSRGQRTPSYEAMIHWEVGRAWQQAGNPAEALAAFQRSERAVRSEYFAGLERERRSQAPGPEVVFSEVVAGEPEIEGFHWGYYNAPYATAIEGTIWRRSVQSALEAARGLGDPGVLAGLQTEVSQVALEHGLTLQDALAPFIMASEQYATPHTVEAARTSVELLTKPPT